MRHTTFFQAIEPDWTGSSNIGYPVDVPWGVGISLWLARKAGTKNYAATANMPGVSASRNNGFSSLV